MRTKIEILSILFLLIFVAASTKLFYWQVIRGGSLSQEAKYQYRTGKVLQAPRGNILAKDGSFLAARGEGWLVFANIPEVNNPAKIAERLAPFFVEDKEDKSLLLSEIDRLKTLLSKKESVWVPLKQKINSDDKKNIEAMELTGIGFEPQETRFYPEASAAAHLLGFVGKNDEGEDIGYFGLEGFYNSPLAGKRGYESSEKDARGAPILISGGREAAAISGVDLVTSIDKRIQLILEEKLLDGIEKYGAKGGTVVVMDPATGAVMGMASFPAYDPAKYWEFGDALFKNPAISDSFEPGSIFKILVMASALDKGVVEPDSKCEDCGGPLKVDKYLIETWDKKYRPDSTMVDIIVNSNNVGMASVGQRLGAEALFDYLDKFGIGRASGIDLQGEIAPPLRKKSDWNIVDLATASFGQGVAVTPIQMLRAAGAIANKGVLPSPKVIEKIRGDGWEEKIKTSKGVRVVSEETALQVTAMMAEAARRGESKWTNIGGFKVAGKTGTAQIPIAGHYDEEKTIASFVGFAPYDRPKFVMLVTLKEPQSSPWASETAAPLWYAIAKELFPYLGIHPE